MKIIFQGQTMQVFRQLRLGRLRLYNAAVEDSMGTVEEAWQRGMLGKTFVVRPITDQVIGEEVLDGNGRVIAVFGVAITNAFVPDQQPQKEYLEKLTAVLREL